MDALGNPVAFHLTAGQAHDLNGADAFLPDLQADALLADRSYDVDGRYDKRAVNFLAGVYAAAVCISLN